jgi:oligopeptide/dipeptide ABC transporter ATP-binding protein
LGVVAQNAEKIIVMYAGRIVEQASTKELFENPKHPYTRALLNVVLDINSTEVKTIEGQPPSIEDEISGCSFHPRCVECMEICAKQLPELKNICNNHKVSCFLY